MRLLFTKGPAKHDTLDITRPGRPVERIQCPKQRIIPHDMVHFAVEHTLQSRGFLGRLKDGESAAFRMTVDAQADAVERLVEVFQGDEWSGGATPPAEMIELYAVTCRARECPMLPVDDAAILAVRDAIAALSRQWAATAVGGSMELVL